MKKPLINFIIPGNSSNFKQGFRELAKDFLHMKIVFYILCKNQVSKGET